MVPTAWHFHKEKQEPGLEGRRLSYSQVLERVLSPHRATGDMPGFGQEVEDKTRGKLELKPLPGLLWERQDRAEQTAEDDLV